METQFDKEFSKVDLRDVGLKPIEMDQCTFTQCDFSEVNLSARRFIDCTFIECNLSGVNVNQTAFQNCEFDGCKMLGIHFQNVSPFLLQLKFNDCQLSHSIFYKLPLKETQFIRCELSHCDFSEAQLQKASFSFSTFNRTIFDQTHLENSDVRDSKGFYLELSNNFLTGMMIDREQALGLLANYKLKIE